MAKLANNVPLWAGKVNSRKRLRRKLIFLDVALFQTSPNIHFVDHFGGVSAEWGGVAETWQVLSVLPDFATSSDLNAAHLLATKHNSVINSIFGFLRSRSIQNIPSMLGYLEYFSR